MEQEQVTQAEHPIPEQTKLVSVAKMQELERATDARGHSFAAMMEQAGEAVADAICEEQPVPEMTPVVVLVGPGNNGGDGLVCARHLQEAGYPVRVYLWKRRTDPEHDYEGHFGKLAQRNTPATRVEEDADFATLRTWLEEARVVVDALLGTGANRPIAGELAALLDQVAEIHRARHEDPESEPLEMVAVDCPSGLNCDTGAVDPHTLPADMTVTFGYAKLGHFKFPGAALVGQLVVADIGIEPELAADVRTFVLTPDYVAGLLPHRGADSHKGTFGKALAVVGSVNYPGAARLSCGAMGRVGAGLVTGAVPEPVWPVVASALAEPTWLLLAHELGVLSDRAVETVDKHLSGYDALLLGCGLTQEDATRDFVHALLTRSRAGRHSVLPKTFHAEPDEGEIPSAPSDQALLGTPFAARRRPAPPPDALPPLPPTVMDADGLNNLAKLDNWPDLLPPQCILTPHPAEMARLCGLEVAEVKARRWELAREKAAAWRAVVLVKGPYTVIAHPDGRLAVLPVATPALATAGTGDVLAGAITGFLAQGLAPFDAACLGAWVHGRAGELCEEEIGPAGPVAGDLLSRLPIALNALRGFTGAPRSTPYEGDH